MRRTWKVSVLCLAAVSIVAAWAESDKSVTAAEVNGTWKTKGGEFKIWALGQQRLQVEFSGVYEYKTPQGPSANSGEGSGIATIEGRVLHFIFVEAGGFLYYAPAAGQQETARGGAGARARIKKKNRLLAVG